jgi:hypothetical protein
MHAGSTPANKNYDKNCAAFCEFMVQQLHGKSVVHPFLAHAY